MHLQEKQLKKKTYQVGYVTDGTQRNWRTARRYSVMWYTTRAMVRRSTDEGALSSW